jgi:D-alanine-D-alanine ligase
LSESLQVALVYSSKKKARKVLGGAGPDGGDARADRPSDLLVEYDGDKTIAAVAGALARRFRVTLVEADDRAYSRLKRNRPDLVFNISEGFHGPNREAHIPIICEMLGLAYTGSDGLTLGICLDKARAKEILAFNGIPTPAFAVCADPRRLHHGNRLPVPAIVKPLREGSSKGIRNDSVVLKRSALRSRVAAVIRQYHQPALVEEFLPGREFTAGVFGNAPDFEILPLIEINHKSLPPHANPIYSYEAKWVWDLPERPLDILVCPARVPPRLRAQIHAIVKRALTVLGVRDWCRVDLRLDSAGHPKIIELNPLPGIAPDPRDNSALPAAARAAGYSYHELILRVAQAAIQRQDVR